MHPSSRIGHVVAYRLVYVLEMRNMAVRERLLAVGCHQRRGVMEVLMQGRTK